jgi:TonB family protein
MSNVGRVPRWCSLSLTWLAAVLISGMLGPCAFADVVRVTEVQARKSVIQKVEPTYPPIARQMRLSGHVVLDMYVDESGNVEKVDVISGNPILGSAAVSAAKQWKFQPFQNDGKVTKAVIRVGFDFTSNNF